MGQRTAPMPSDATTLGKPKMIVFGLQHMFMFGATILVPVLTGLSVSATLFCSRD